MSKKQDSARAAKAREVNRFSVQLAGLRSSWRWISRDILDGAAQKIDQALGEMDFDAFALAQNLASGRVELDLPDEPRPLFERLPDSAGQSKLPSPDSAGQSPPEPEPFAIGTPLFGCNRCNRPRPRNVAICPWCQCPEFGLFVVDEHGQIAIDKFEPPPPYSREARAAKKPRKPSPKGKKSTSVESAPLTDSAGQSPKKTFHCDEVHLEDDGSGNPHLLVECHAQDLADAIKNAPEWFKADVIPGTPLVVKPGKSYHDDPGIPYGSAMAECSFCGKRRPPKSLPKSAKKEAARA